MNDTHTKTMLDFLHVLEKAVEDSAAYETFPTEIERREFLGYHRGISHVYMVYRSMLDQSGMTFAQQKEGAGDGQAKAV